MNSSLHCPVFDLHLSLYRLIKPDYETRMDFNIQIDELHKKGLLKNHKHPFFIFKDNRCPSSFVYGNKQIKSDLLKQVIDSNYNSLGLYSVYLPRVNTLSLLEIHPELETFFSKGKHSLNEFKRFELNPLISENEKFDWFIYDDESMNFLMEMQKTKIDVKSRLKYINNKIYFEDVCESQKLSDSDLEQFFVSLTIIVKNENNVKDIITKKTKINSKMTAFDLIVNMNKKVQLMKSELAFDPEKKILKVRSLNDFIFSIHEPMINFTYLNECVKENKDAEYCIIDNPLNSVVEEEVDDLKNKVEDVEDSVINPTAFYNRNHFDNLLNIAVNDPLKKQQEEITNPLEYLDKLPYLENPEIEPDNLLNFMTEVTNDINEEIQKSYENSINNIKDEDIEIAKDVKNYEEEDIKTINERFNLSNMSMISSLNQSSFFILNNTSMVKGKKKHGIKQTPNVFVESEKTVPNIKDYFDGVNSTINIKDVDRPFSIIVKNAHLNQIFNSYVYDKNVIHTVLLFKFQVFCGSQPFSKPKQIKWKTRSTDINPLFNKRIYFEVNYNTLPNFASVLFKVKFIQYNKNYEVVSNGTVGWCNFRLFDHHKKLKTGIHKLNLYNRTFSDDAYYCFTDSNEDNCSDICFEIDTFARPVVNKVVHIKNYNLNIKSLMMSPTDMQKINEIMEKSPFDELNNYDKEVLWTNRYSLAKMPSIVPRLLMCFNYNDPRHLIELEKIFELAKELNPVQALELLSGKYLHESIRNFAVKCLKKASWVDVSNYLLQLVQGLKYEIDHDSELARFLLTMAINHPVTIGHSLFWSLRSEMYNQDVQQRFGLYLEVFLNKIGPTLGHIFNDEDFLIKNLIKIAEIPKDASKGKTKKMDLFTGALEAFNQTLENEKRAISIPLNFKYRIVSIDVKKCKYMKSKKKPLWLIFKNDDEIGEDIVVMFKKGDDLRMDMVTLQLFKAMQTLWFEHKLKLKMSLYGVMCTGYNQGMLEMVMNSETLAAIHIKEGGAIQSFFSKTSLKKWIETNSILPEAEYTENFLLSSVAYCVATFVLGVGDRHNDNIMVKRNGEVFHIDFGHFLGHFKYKMGIKRERAPFVFTKQFQSVLGGEKGAKFLEFKNLMWQAYQLLRANSESLVTLLRILLCTGIPELDEKSIKFLDYSLALNMGKDEAKKFLEDRLNDSINSVSTKVNFAIHIVANQ